VELVELHVAQARSLRELGGNLVLERAATRSGADGDPLQTRSALEHLAAAGQAVAVGNHQARDDCLAESPARLDHPLVASGDGVDGRPGEREARRHGQPGPESLSEPDRLGAEDRGVRHLLQREDARHAKTVTSPASPSTRTRAPSLIRSVPSRVPTTPGMPYSRATIAEWES